MSRSSFLARSPCQRNRYVAPLDPSNAPEHSPAGAWEGSARERDRSSGYPRGAGTAGYDRPPCHRLSHPGSGRTRAHHISGPVAGPQLLEKRPQLFDLDRINHIVGIQPKRVITRRVRKCFVPCRREIIDPLEIEHLRSKLAGDLLGSIGASRIDDNDLVKDPFDRGQAPGRFSSSFFTIIVNETLAVR